MVRGIIGQQAPELRVEQWIDAAGKPSAPLRLGDLGNGPKILLCFQDGCGACHSRGFPIMRALKHYLPSDWGFAAIQTPFESPDRNNFDKLRVNQERARLEIPFGHDPAPAGEPYPSIMGDYVTGGTPWFIVVEADGTVSFNDFRFNIQRFLDSRDAETVRFDQDQG